MATCPVCQSAIELTAQHFGTLFTCPKCSAVFFVDWSGQPEVASADEELPPVSKPVPAVDDTPFEPFLQQVSGPSSEGEFAQDVDNFPSHNYANDAAPAGSEHNDSEFSEGASAPESSSSNSDYTDAPAQTPFGSEQSNTSHFEPVAQGGSDLESSSFLDVSEFGNSETTQAAFNYSVTIAGIDSAMVRAALVDVLSDSKFGWQTVELVSQIKDGVLTIRSVSAIKAGILVQRIKYLPVKISWRQDVLSGST